MARSKILLYIGTTLLVLGMAGLTFAKPASQATRPSGALEIRFSTIEKAAFEYGRKEQGYFVVDTVAEWENLWKEIYPNDLGRPDLFPVIFASTTVIAVFQGETASRGYYIEVEKIIEEATVLRVVVTEFSPSPECAMRDAATYPFHLVTVPKAGKEIIFDAQKKIRECRAVVHPHSKQTQKQIFNVGSVFQ